MTDDEIAAIKARHQTLFAPGQALARAADIIRRARRYVGMVRSDDVDGDDPIYAFLDEMDALLAEVERLRADLERVQMQVVACGVVAQSNTPENAATMRATIAAAYRTDALRCVEAAVDREMALRMEVADLIGRGAAQHEAVEAAQADAAALREALKWLDRWLGHKPMTECTARISAALARAGGGA